MGKVYNNRIETTAGYTLNSETPLDDRLSVATLNDLTTLVSLGVAYDNMIVGVTGLGIYKYYKDGNKWIRQAKVKNITRDSKSIDVLDEVLDNDSVDTINIKDSAITKNKLNSDVISSILNTKGKRYAGYEPPKYNTYCSEDDNPEVGDIYIELDKNNNSCKALWLRESYSQGYSNWKGIWKNNISYIDTSAIFDDAITNDKLSDNSVTESKLDLNLLNKLYNEHARKFTGTTDPHSNTDINKIELSNVGDIYFQLDSKEFECITIWVRQSYDFAYQKTTWVPLWKKNSSYIDGSSISDNSITVNKLNTNFAQSLIRGTAGTAPMNEGEYLEAGTIYIQYDESV